MAKVKEHWKERDARVHKNRLLKIKRLDALRRRGIEKTVAVKEITSYPTYVRELVREGPVAVTNHGLPIMVVMTTEEYLTLKAKLDSRHDFAERTKTDGEMDEKT